MPRGIGSFCLLVSTNAEANLEFLDQGAVRVAFNFESSHGREDFHAAITRDKLSAVKFVCKCVEFFMHRMLELFLVWTTHGHHFKGRIVLVIFG